MQLKDNEKIIVCPHCGGKGEYQTYYNYLNQPKKIGICCHCNGNGIMKKITFIEAIDKKDLPLYISGYNL